MNISQEKVEKLVIYLLSDEDRMEALLQMDPEAAVDKINAEGFRFTAQELVTVVKEMAALANEKSGELTEEDLDDVAGGALFLPIRVLIKPILGPGGNPFSNKKLPLSRFKLLGW